MSLIVILEIVIVILIEATLVQSYVSIVWTRLRVASSFDSTLMTKIIIVHVTTYCYDNNNSPTNLLLINNNMQIYNNIPLKKMINKT